MAQALPLQKSFTGLMTLVFTFVVVGPGMWLSNTPHASANAPIVVNNLNDAGVGSLRQAMLDANGAGSPGPDSLDIQVAGTIGLLSPLPALTESLDMLATTTVQGNANLVLNLGGAGAGAVGLTLTTGAFNIQGIGMASVMGNVTNGIVINAGVTSATIGGPGAESGMEIYNATIAGISAAAGSSNVTIQNTLIGTGGANAIGISATGVLTLNIGGTNAGEGNIISGNTGNGIQLVNCTTASAQGNRIGLDKNGNILANGGDGIFVDLGNTGVVIGASVGGGRNIISGNTGNGVKVYSNSTVIKGNYIGTNVAGDAAKGNGGMGIRYESNQGTIGGSSSAERNVISGNVGDGIFGDSTFRNADSATIRNNYIGINAAGTAAIANGGKGINISGPNITSTSIRQNVISGNATGGIDIEGAGSTGNVIIGNFIGTDAAGTAAIANTGSGVVIGSDSNFIGQVGDVNRNVISGNSTHGIELKGDLNSVVNNFIGTDITGLIVISNTNNGIQLSTGATSNVMGGTIAGTANTILIVGGGTGVNVNNDASDFNLIRENNLPGITRGGIANENIAAPVIISSIRTTPSNINVQGTTGTPNGIMDFMIDGTFIATSIADAAGSFDVNITSAIGAKVFASVTNGTNSTSGTSGLANITADVTAPVTPTLSYSSTGTTGATVTISLTGAEVGTTVYVNGVNTGTVVALVGGDGVATSTSTLVEGTNTFSITTMDGMSNVSIPAVATITAITPGGGTAGTAGHSTNNSHSAYGATPINTETTDQTAIAAAGDIEVVSDPVVSAPTESPATNNSSVTSDTSNATPTVAPESKPAESKPIHSQKHFLSGIYQYAPEPIKQALSVSETLRATMPVKPARKVIYTANLLKNPIFGADGDSLPKVIEMKLGGADPMADDDDDGLLNAEEVWYGSSFKSSDTDGDGQPDFQEVEFIGTNPNRADTDGDGRNDSDEIAAGTNPLVHNDIRANFDTQILTDYSKKYPNRIPGLDDSDKDGLCDLFEMYLGTNPDLADSDNDGISDGNEVQYLGTDPLNGTAAGVGGVFRVANARDGDIFAQGSLFITGVASKANSTVGLYEVSKKGDLTLLGETVADEIGRWQIFSIPISTGTHTLVAIQGNSLKSWDDLSGTFTIQILPTFPQAPEYLSMLQNGASVTNKDLQLDLKVANDYMVTVAWHSTIYSQTFIADNAHSIVNATPPKELELSAHTVTWDATDMKTGKKSTPTQIAFNVTNEAFVSGQVPTESSSIPWSLIVGSIAVLGSLSALGLYLRKPKSTLPPSEG